MIDYSEFLSFARSHAKFRAWSDAIEDQIAQGLSTQRYGDLPQWYESLAQLPDITPSHVDLLHSVTIGKPSNLTREEYDRIETAFRALIPWRKGPFDLFGLPIDTEWRSDWKWQRLLPHISPLQNRTVLDVGCGNGYHALRIFGEGARRVLGIDPSPRFVVQYAMLKHFLGAIPVDVLPLGIEALPAELLAFNTVFSMGVLYHRASPIDHLKQLKGALTPGGELVLETLIIEGDQNNVLVPEGRYAKMNNVWFIPSADALVLWLKKCGFENARCVDTNKTSLNEQRATEWMQYQSLADFLDPQDIEKTIEGHPAPYRGIFIANAPLK